jgi:hypothetical protein
MSILLPFQFDFLMDISHGIERLEIAQNSHFKTPVRNSYRQRSGHYPELTNLHWYAFSMWVL